MSFALGKNLEFNSEMCIICQTRGGKLLNLATGKNKIIKYAENKKDIVFLTLSLIQDNNFVYHPGNMCYKRFKRPYYRRNFLV